MFSTCTQSDRVFTGEDTEKKTKEVLPQFKEKVDAQINFKHISNQHKLEICLPNDEDDVFDVYVQQKTDREDGNFPSETPEVMLPVDLDVKSRTTKCMKNLYVSATRNSGSISTSLLEPSL